MNLSQTIATFIATLGVAYLFSRGIYRAGQAAGFLDGRNFMIKRRLLLRSTVWVDGLPVNRAAAVWIETNDFPREELDRIAALRQWENNSALIDTTLKRAE